MKNYEKRLAQMIGNANNLDPYIQYNAILSPLNERFREAFCAYEHPETHVDARGRKQSNGSNGYQYKIQHNRKENIPFHHAFYYKDENESEEERIKIAKEQIISWMGRSYTQRFKDNFDFVEGKDYTMDLHKEEFEYDLTLPI